MPWLILSLDELERLQPHISAGMSIANLLNQLRREQFDTVLEGAHRETGRTDRDTFLWRKGQEMIDRIGAVDNKIL